MECSELSEYSDYSECSDSSDYSKGLPIFALGAVAQHGEVRLVAAGGDTPVQCRFIDRTAGFPRVGTVAVAAVLRNVEDFAEIVPHLFFLHVNSAESLDARGVNNPTAVLRQGVHFREGGRVGAFVVGVGDGNKTPRIGKYSVEDKK